MRINQRKSFGKTLFVLVSASLSTLLGCDVPPKSVEDLKKSESFSVEVDSYLVEVSYYQNQRCMNVIDKTEVLTAPNSNPQNSFNPYITATDNGSDDRFDTIQLNGIPKGHRLEEYADLQTLQQTFEKAFLEYQRKKAEAEKTEKKVNEQTSERKESSGLQNIGW